MPGVGRGLLLDNAPTEVEPSLPPGHPLGGGRTAPMPARHPAEYAAHAGFGILLFLTSWPFASSVSFWSQTEPTAWTKRADSVSGPPCMPTVVTMISFEASYSFRPLIPRANRARAILTYGERPRSISR